MNIHRSHVIPASDADLARQLRALAHPVRLKILRALAASEGCGCGAIVEALPLAQSTISEHLRVLRQAGLVTCETRGTRCCYSLERAVIRQLEDRFGGLMSALAVPERQS